MSMKLIRPTVIAASLFALANPAIAEISGSVGFGFKAESDKWEKRNTASEMEYDLLKGSLQFSQLEDWSFDYRIGREVLYDGNLKSGSKEDGDYGHSDNTYSVGAHYTFNENWGIRAGYEYENKKGGSTELSLLPDYNVALNETTDFYITFGAVYDINKDYSPSFDSDLIWLIAMPGISTEIGEDTLALDFYFEVDEELNGDDYRYEEYGIYPSYTTPLSEDLSLTYSAFVGIESETMSGQKTYEERYVGIGVDAAYKVTQQLAVKGGLGWEHRWEQLSGDDNYEPEARFAMNYNF